MCGILALIGNYPCDFKNVSNNLSHRGPDSYKTYFDENVFMGFNRLRINDVTETGDQPMELNNVYMIYHGEIFNHKEIENTFNLQMTSKSDCEVLLHLYFIIKNYNHLCNALDAEFAFVIHDKTNNIQIAARDPFGVRPLFYQEGDNFVGFSSELKGFPKLDENIKQFPPGNFAIIKNNQIKVLSPYISIKRHINFNINNENLVCKTIKDLFTKAVHKRLMSDKEVCSLLSGGLDSSLVAALVAQKTPHLKTFSIGMKNSPDLDFAKKVADHIGSEHTSILLDKQDFLNAIEIVIKTIESYDTTSVRASVGNYLVSKYIKENTNCKVVFNGDYADEVAGGYKYFKKCDDPIEFNNECCRLVDHIHFFDSLRSDRCISAHGLEARVPFADIDFVNYYLKIDPTKRMSNNRIEKYLIRKAFEKDNLLPEDVLWRNKEAFSDGVSHQDESWYQIITKYVDELISDEEFKNSGFDLKETYYYKKIFDKYYPKNTDIIPYLWLPQYCGNIKDPSARVL